jgi:hypothetical protein
LQFSELLPVPLALLVMLATPHLEDADLVMFAMRKDRRCNCCTGHQGSANPNFGAISDGQNLVNDNLLAYVRSNLFYFNFFAGSNTILFATGFYDRVHVNLFIEFCGRISTEPLSIAWFAVTNIPLPRAAEARKGISIILQLFSELSLG